MSQQQGNTALFAMSQLREAQEKLRAAEVRAACAEEENKRLRQMVLQAYPGEDGRTRVRNAEQDGRAAAKQAMPQGADGLIAGGDTSASSSGHNAIADGLVRELKNQLVDLTKRNCEVERAANERIAIMRRQYESHIDALELELRRAKAGGRNVAYSQGGGGGTPQQQQYSSGAAASSTTPRQPATWGSSPAASPSAGRTAESRRNLL